MGNGESGIDNNGSWFPVAVSRAIAVAGDGWNAAKANALTIPDSRFPVPGK
jgi:hypothetical protein